MPQFRVWAAFSGFIGAALALGFLSFSQDDRPTPLRAEIAPVERLLTYEDLPGLFEGFACTCCGEAIGACQCGLAENMRADVRQRVEQGIGLAKLNMGMFASYGSGVFFDEEVAARARADLEASLPADRPILSADPMLLDLGSVTLDQAPYRARFALFNQGRSDLVINGLETSCGCTTAVLQVGDWRSPPMGMGHSQEGDGFSVILPPGGKANIYVSMDPLFHGDAVLGPVMRTIRIQSNDPMQPRFDLGLRLEVLE